MFTIYDLGAPKKKFLRVTYKLPVPQKHTPTLHRSAQLKESRLYGLKYANHADQTYLELLLDQGFKILGAARTEHSHIIIYLLAPAADQRIVIDPLELKKAQELMAKPVLPSMGEEVRQRAFQAARIAINV